MRRVPLSSDRFAIFYGAVKGNPEGFRGPANIRNAMKLLDKLEALACEDPATKGWTFLAPVVGEVVGESALDMTEEEYALLQQCMGNTAWAGPGVHKVAEALDALDAAK